MKQRIRTTGGDLAYIDEGVGPAVVLVHGFPTSSVLWRGVVPRLAERMRVIAVDLVGFGRSEKPDGAALHIRAQAGYVRELLQGKGIEEFAVAGHDIGGGVAQLLALEGRAAALAVLDSICFDAWPIEGVKMLQTATPEQETSEFVDQVVRLTIDLGVSHKERFDETALDSCDGEFSARDLPHSRGLSEAEASVSGLGIA